MLRHPRDLQSLAYLAAQPALAAWQWQHGFSFWLFATMLLLAIGISVIHHNHAHLPLWRTRALNRATDLWITLVQGHPTWVFVPAHNGNHHRHQQGARDVARTSRFGGDRNTLAGCLLHPLQAIGVLYPLLFAWWRARPARMRRWMALQHVAWLASWAALLLIDARKALLLVIVPQLVGLHWLLAANYLQHAHTDPASRWNRARNFTGPINLAWFNIGYHTAHHEAPRAHWSTLPRLHAALAPHIDARLIERSLVRYVLRVFVLGAVLRAFASRPLAPPPGVDTRASGQ
ncbi:fatty acid desaturase [Chiayiivirga flava]|uniref:Fatty acid desaturase n=1 Tax=Chiayiivirga flava TaxID=659595 RepID=A0A7W8G0I0_9GAMM|nr:fatty acid desaturase [Chiayiivirga flava]MBB5207773.1 fatty acid desaturase [Chiayiivirga flava]